MRNLENKKDQEYLRRLMDQTRSAADRLKGFIDTHVTNPEVRQRLHEDAVNIGANAILVKHDYLGDSI